MWCSAWYAVWIGANDVLDIADNSALALADQQAEVAAAVSNEVSVIEGLAAHGAQNLVVLNVPDLGVPPHEMARGPAAAQSAESLASLYNTDLASAVQSLEASGALRIDLMDTDSAINQAIANPSAYGFTNVSDLIRSGDLTDSSRGTQRATGAAQNQFLFFDPLHPTGQAHALLAADVTQSLPPVA